MHIIIGTNRYFMIYRTLFESVGKMNYRLGTRDDLKEIGLLITEVINHMETAGIYQWDSIYPTEEDFEDDIIHKNLYILEEEQEIAALYVINQEADEEYSNCLWNKPAETACVLHRLCVSPRYQNKGLGKCILNHIEKQAKEMSYQSIRLDVYSKNPYALSLYRKNNYIERGFADWRKGRFILMEKEL